MSSGHLSYESRRLLRVTWTIPDFFRVATESGFSLQSPDFTFADGRYCLRMYQIRDFPYDYIVFEILNSSDPDPGRSVSYEVELKSRNEDSPVRRYLDEKKLFRLIRRNLEECRDEYVPDGTLTVLCSMRSREPGSAGSPESGGAQTQVFPQYKMTGNVSSELCQYLYVTWRIPAFLLPIEEFLCDVESLDFPFSDRHYLLRLVSSDYDLEIELVDLADPFPGTYVWYEFGLKSTTGEEIEIKGCGESYIRHFIFPRSDLCAMQLVRFPDGHLTVFCCVQSREPSSAGSPKCRGAETSNEEALPGCRPSLRTSSGDLSFESRLLLRVTWAIPDFFRLATESGFSLQSPDFTFSDGRYCLRLFQWRIDPDWFVIELLNSIDSDPGRAVSYEVELKSGIEGSLLRRDVDDKKVFGIERRRLEEYKYVCVPDGTLTVLCSVRSREQGSAGSPESGGAQTRFFPEYRMTGNLSSAPYPFLYVTWRIPAFFRTIRESRRNLESPEFPFSDRRYHLQLCPCSSEYSIGFVNLSGRVPGRYVWYEVGLKSASGVEIEMRSFGISTARKFHIRESELRDMQPVLFPDGHLTVFCCMLSREPSSTGCLKSRGAENDKEALPGGVEKVLSDYKRLLLKGAASDACLVVGGKEFQAHKCVLRARSPVFEAMFEHETTEKASGRVVIDDLQPDRFHDFLEYLYTGRIESFCDDNVFGLYVAADKYDVPTLKSECVEYMRKSLYEDNFCDVITLTLRYDEKDLLEQAVNFFKKNVVNIIFTVKWQQFISENSTIANEFFIKLHVPETESENMQSP